MCNYAHQWGACDGSPWFYAGLFFAESKLTKAYEVALAAGGTAIEDAPGWRGDERMKFYLAYLRDPSGNKVCVMHRPPKVG